MAAINLKGTILPRLQERGVRVDCAECGNSDWAVTDQSLSLLINNPPRNPVPHQIPAGALICNNCGNVRLFALGPLGLMPKELSDLLHPDP